MPTPSEVSVICYQWNNGYREYKPEYVNVLARSVARHLSIPHRFICVTEETEGFEVETFKPPEDCLRAARLRTPENHPKLPSCYRRMWTFSKEATCLGDRVLLLDIDCVILRSLDHLFECDADFVGWVPATVWGLPRIGGGTWLHRTGTRTHVWESLNANAVKKVREKGYRGSDQAWISYHLGKEAKWPRDCGIVQWKDLPARKVKPRDACIVHFNGEQKPWHRTDIEWIRKHWH